MNAIELLLQSGAVGPRSSMRAAVSKLPLRVRLRSSSLLEADTAVTSELRKAFLENEDLRDEFAQRYGQEMEKGRQSSGEGFSVENGQHNALVGTIRAHRSVFPKRSFTLKTELPGGDALETEIPAYAASVSRVQTASSGAANKLATLLGDLQAEGAVQGEGSVAAGAHGVQEP